MASPPKAPCPCRERPRYGSCSGTVNLIGSGRDKAHEGRSHEGLCPSGHAGDLGPVRNWPFVQRARSGQSRQASLLTSVTGRAQDAVTGRVVSELILAEQAGPDRGAALRARHIGHHSGLLAGLDVLDLEVAAVGNHREAVRAERRSAQDSGVLRCQQPQ